MYYNEVKVEQPRKKFDHAVTPPKDVGFWWVGSSWLRIKRVNSQFQALPVGNLGDNTMQRALM
eukprot:5536837-Prorocentrum_lima.AAC.1